jgi:hypothetical protein
MVFCYSYDLHEAKYQVRFYSLLLHYTIVLHYSIAQIDITPPPPLFLKFTDLGQGAWGVGTMRLQV